MLTDEELRRKIESAKELHAIVRTMKTLAAVNIHQFEQAVMSAAAYNHTIEMGLRIVLGNTTPDSLFQLVRPEGRTGAIIFGTDQGLCGGFNDQIVSFALDALYEHDADRQKRLITCIGGRASTLVEERGQPVDEGFSVPDSLPGITPLVQKLLLRLDAWQSREAVTTVMLYHHHPVSSVSCQPGSRKLLPADQQWFKAIAGMRWPSRVLPTYTMHRKRLFSTLIRQHLFVSLYRATAESMASENAARLTSMQASERNIEERLEELRMRYQLQRQSTITAELLDIVAGAEALRQDRP